MPQPEVAQAEPVETPEVAAATALEPDPATGDGESLDEESPLITWVRRLPRPRRSTVLIALGVLVFATMVAVALTLVQRVQTDPLRIGAEQVARLSPDPTFPLPAIFGDVDEDDFAVYEEYRGLRTIVAKGAFAPPGARCLFVLLASGLPQDGENNVVGASFSGCGAGEFPATTQFVIDESLGTELRSAFPEGTALQFVYDEANDEVVVFSDR